MDKEIEKVVITFSDGTQETYNQDVMVVALEGGGVACCGSFRCKLERARQVAMTMVMQAGKIFEEGISREGEEQIWSGEREKGFDFPNF